MNKNKKPGDLAAHPGFANSRAKAYSLGEFLHRARAHIDLAWRDRFPGRNASVHL
jgi:hypothetical protein